MALTPSNMIPLKNKAPRFCLPDTVSGMHLSTQDVKGEKGLLVMFICNHCPYVVHINEEIVRLGKDYLPQGIGVVAISSNDVTHYPEDAPEFMQKVAKEQGYPFAYLYDEDQSIARAYDAACTPDFFLYDQNEELVYRGQLDDSRPGNNRPLTGKDLRAALDALLLGEKIPEIEQRPSSGCNIKWKK